MWKFFVNWFTQNHITSKKVNNLIRYSAELKGLHVRNACFFTRLPQCIFSEYVRIKNNSSKQIICVHQILLKSYFFIDQQKKNGTYKSWNFVDSEKYRRKW